ncbi:TonB-dependent receptor domain-containing protein [Niveispirillum sp. KHB5.9]|uniref:TonB-dependent receptor domain-containing protein n=1 Tax=Niveispirillum sp. KHB5.9 TaxID=3400269 RepID=UPI003A8846E0
MSRVINRLGLLAGTAMVLAGLNATGVAAQDLELAEIVVTGTRIRSPNLTTASPLTAVGQEEIKFQGATAVESVLNRLPQFTADANENVSNGSDGTARVNLRNLGSNRNLILIDGQRMLPPETADVNFIPSAMIERVDVVSGGASAVYGSDAISGVVNFILRKNLDGVHADMQYSINHTRNDNDYVRSLMRAKGFELAPKSVWDGAKKDVNVAMGFNSDDKKGNVTLYAGYREANPVTQDSRDYSACGLNLDGPNALVCGGSSNNAYGLFTLLTGPNKGRTVNNAKDGQKNWVPYDSSFLYNYAPDNYIQRTDSRVTAGANGHYELAQELEVYGSFMFMDDHTYSQAAPSALFQGTLFKINCNNPLMSSAQATMLCGTAAGTATNQDTFIGYRLTGPGSQPRRDDLRHTAYRVSSGVRGKLGDNWTYDANFLYSSIRLEESYKNNVDNAKAQKALQVVNVNGVPTCQSKIDGTDTSCVPIDVFKYNGISAEGYQYLYAPTYTRGVQTERVFSAGITGQLGDYGFQSPLASQGFGFAAGAEHRDETLDFQADALAQAGGTKPNNGKLNVEEFYSELQVPLVQDKDFVKDLSFNGGYRMSRYSNNDDWVKTYKTELQYAPTGDVRFRGSYNRAVRAANISELYAQQSLGNVAAVDPCAGSKPTASLAACQKTGVTAAQYGNIPECPAEVCVAQGGGNPLLKPEEANTYTAGIVLTPEMVRNFSLTVDYFKIGIDKYIGSVDTQTVIRQCIETGNPFFCSLFHRDPAIGVLFGNNGYVVSTNQNTGFLRTSGLDIQANYGFELEDVIDNDLGRVDVGLVGTWLLSRKTEQLPGLGSYDCKGLFGPTCGQPNPTWRHQLRTTWGMPWMNASLSVNWRYFGSTKLSSNTDNQFLKGDLVNINGKIASYSYFDLSGSVELLDGVAMRAGVNNIFDKAPPAIAAGLLSAFGNGNTYPGVYDPMGMNLFVGLTVDF